MHFLQPTLDIRTDFMQNPEWGALMSISFNADEILEIAQQIEQNGLNFYKAAAHAVTDPKAKEILSDLAEWEAGHEKLFRDMRAGLTDQQRQPMVFDPYDEMGLYLEATANQVVFTSKMDPAEMIGANPSFRKILNIALEREKDAVVFYAGIRKFVPASLGKDKIEAILLEEVSHVALITQRLAEIE
jgi:rubrerythrin